MGSVPAEGEMTHPKHLALCRYDIGGKYSCPDTEARVRSGDSSVPRPHRNHLRQRALLQIVGGDKLIIPFC